LEGEPAHVGTFHGHRVDLRRSRPLRDEGDALAVRTPGGGDVDAAGIRHAAHPASVELRDVHVGVVVLGRGEEQARSVGRVRGAVYVPCSSSWPRATSYRRMSHLTSVAGGSQLIFTSACAPTVCHSR